MNLYNSGGGNKTLECQFDVPLSQNTWIHRGGIVKYWWTPKDISELIEIGKFLNSNNQVFITIGHTSNIYFKNSFNIDHIIDTRKLTSYQVKDENIVICDCGVHIAKLSKWAVEEGFIGYEGLINLPGTVAGAVVNNSGCYGCGIDKILKSIDLLNIDGTIVNIESGELGYSFRSSSLKTGMLKGIILRAYLDISNKGLPGVMKKIADDNTINRKRYQDPPAFNLGSTVNLGRLYPSSKIHNLIIRSFAKVYRLIESDTLKQNKITKDLILLLYGKRYLARYISDKRNSCFLWKDEKADEYFEDYLGLMRKLYKQVSIEIEIYS